MHRYVPTPETSGQPLSHVAPVAIVGARGYAGLELVRILLRHPGAKVVAAFAADSSFSLADYLPEAAAGAVPVLPMTDFEKTLSEVKSVFLATPAEVSAELAQKAIAAGVDVIDLSGAFRLSPDKARRHYAIEGGALSLLSQAQYALVPWASPTTGKSPKLISNPGCYATATLMALIPLLKEGLIEASSIVVDAKSGATGAGRKAAENLLFCEVDGECLPYKVGDHQHLPEIIEAIERFAGVKTEPAFATHLLPVRRGIIASIYAKTSSPEIDEAAIAAAFEKAYGSYPLARWGALQAAEGELRSPTGIKDRHSVSLKRIAGSARTEIRFTIRGRQLYLFSLIDNLLKGAASQAVENFNRTRDFPVQTALEQLEGTL